MTGKSFVNKAMHIINNIIKHINSHKSWTQKSPIDSCWAIKICSLKNLHKNKWIIKKKKKCLNRLATRNLLHLYTVRCARCLRWLNCDYKSWIMTHTRQSTTIDNWLFHLLLFFGIDMLFGLQCVIPCIFNLFNIFFLFPPPLRKVKTYFQFHSILPISMAPISTNSMQKQKIKIEKLTQKLKYYKSIHNNQFS